MLKQTPFHPRVEAHTLSWDWRRWAGYVVASKYDLTHEREYHAIRNTAALIDVSPLYKYNVQGPDAARFLNRLTPRDVASAAVGRVLYTVWCDEGGNVIEDGTIARLAPGHFRVTAADPSLRWFQDNGLGLDVTIEDVSEQWGALAVQGPASRRVLLAAGADGVASLPYYQITNSQIAGCEVQISRTGYTGDLGYELWVPPSGAEAVWQALIAVGHPYGLAPAGMLALDIARIEAGLLLVDIDYTPATKALTGGQKSNPFELGLGWLVNLDRPEYFVGREALAQAQQQGVPWQFVGIEIEWNSLEMAYVRAKLPPAVPHTAWRQSVPLYSPSGAEVGYATSGCFSPLLKRYIALATLQTPYAQPGTPLEMEITVEHMRRRAKARVAKLPFFNPSRKRRSYAPE